MGEAEKLTPDSDERMYACLAHFLQMIGGFIGPLIIFVLKRESRFVAFHAVQVLLWQVVMMIGWIVVMTLFFSVFFAGMAASGPKPSGPPPAFFFVFPLFWLMGMAGWVVTLILAIVYGVKAMRGEWAAYPVIGQWARRLLGV